MKPNLARTFLVLGLAPFSFYIVGCVPPHSGGGVSQQQVKEAFAGFTNGTSQASTGSQSNITSGPPDWSITYTYTQAGGGSITFVFDIHSTDNLNNPSVAGQSGTYSGYLQFTNFSANGYVFNGTINLGGSFNTTSAGNGDVLLDGTYNYSGSLNVSGTASFAIGLNYSMSLSEDLTAGYVASGPTFTGPVTVNGTNYDVRSLSANVAPMSLAKVIKSLIR